MKQPVLFTEPNSNYGVTGQFDVYDLSRNALSYNDDIPVIAHPPCRLFSKLKAFSTAPACEKFLGIWSISLVRNIGGIVEHPLHSDLFKIMQCGVPGIPDRFGGFVLSVDLNWFGFSCRKPTGLYIVGVDYKDVPPYPLSFNAITHTISSTRKSNLPEINKRFRSSTPPALIEYLVSIINLISK